MGKILGKINVLSNRTRWTRGGHGLEARVTFQAHGLEARVTFKPTGWQPVPRGLFSGFAEDDFVAVAFAFDVHVQAKQMHKCLDVVGTEEAAHRLRLQV